MPTRLAISELTSPRW